MGGARGRVCTISLPLLGSRIRRLEERAKWPSARGRHLPVRVHTSCQLGHHGREQEGENQRYIPFSMSTMHHDWPSGRLVVLPDLT